jgi:hypothetical protein
MAHSAGMAAAARDRGVRRALLDRAIDASAHSANVGGMRRPRLAIVQLAAAAALAASVSASSLDGVAAHAAPSCKVLSAPRSLGGTLLSLHRNYMRHQPDVHKPTITGPVGRVYLGSCGSERHALASFDARYNGLYFGIEDQPERFIEPPGEGWRDIGNTGGDLCGAAPTALLKGWKLVRSCPG